LIAIRLESITLWSTPFAGAALTTCLLIKGRWRQLPIFFSFNALTAVSTAILSISSPNNRSFYDGLYYSIDVLSILLQLAVIFELMWNVFRPTGVWIPEARHAFLVVGFLGAGAAFGASLLFSPPAFHGAFLTQLRVDTFTGLLTCEAVIAMMLVASHTGLVWKSHVMAVGQGLMFWALFTVSSADIGAYLDPQQRWSGAYYGRVLTFLITSIYWTVSLWRKEPARRPISPALRKYMVALHDQVQYDLGKVGH
jgi:hypothetical protein